MALVRVPFAVSNQAGMSLAMEGGKLDKMTAAQMPVDSRAADETLLQSDDVSLWPAHQPSRPVHYLGNKLRALPDILDAAETLVKGGSTVAGLFTGTTVVAQGFAGRGYKVTAADAQRYSVVFARAMLGIGRKQGKSCSFATLFKVGVTEPNDDFRLSWMRFIDKEADALHDADAIDLAPLSAELPLMWRVPDQPLRQYVEAPQHRSAVGEAPLLTSVYAGSYFGVSQEIAPDELRQNAELALAAGRLTKWQYSAARTAIMPAASSAGKHFAQPLNAGSQRNKKFQAGRLCSRQCDAAVLVDPREPTQWAAALERVAASPQLRAELLTKGHECAAQYRWADAAKTVAAALAGEVR